MNNLIIFVIFVLGATIGSFISVIIDRTKTKKTGIFFGRSQCPNCKKTLKAQNLIPIISWIIQKGKCAKCKKKISSHYPLLELLTGLTLVTTFLTYNFYTTPSQLLNFILYTILFTILITIFFYDLLYKEIPDRFSIPAIIIAIIGGLLLNTIHPISMLYGTLAIGGFFLIQFLISNGRWVGGGDIRLGALMGAILGLRLGFLALVLSYVIGGLFATYLLISKKATRKTQLPFGPFLISGLFLALFFSEEILKTYQSFFQY